MFCNTSNLIGQYAACNPVFPSPISQKVLVFPHPDSLNASTTSFLQIIFWSAQAISLFLDGLKNEEKLCIFLLSKHV